MSRSIVCFLTLAFLSLNLFASGKVIGIIKCSANDGLEFRYFDNERFSAPASIAAKSPIQGKLWYVSFGGLEGRIKKILRARGSLSIPGFFGAFKAKGLSGKSYLFDMSSSLQSGFDSFLEEKNDPFRSTWDCLCFEEVTFEVVLYQGTCKLRLASVLLPKFEWD